MKNIMTLFCFLLTSLNSQGQEYKDSDKLYEAKSGLFIIMNNDVAFYDKSPNKKEQDYLHLDTLKKEQDNLYVGRTNSLIKGGRNWKLIPKDSLSENITFYEATPDRYRSWVSLQNWLMYKECAYALRKLNNKDIEVELRTLFNKRSTYSLEEYRKLIFDFKQEHKNVLTD